MTLHTPFYRLPDEKPIIRVLNTKQIEHELDLKGNTKGWDFNLFYVHNITRGVNGLEFVVEFLYTPKDNYPF